MPFSLRRREAIGLSRFVAEYLATCDEQSIGAPFYAEEVDAPGAGQLSGTVGAMVWLAPFDSGVSQRLRIDLLPVDDGYVALALSLRRSSGDEGTWLRANRHFVDGVRRQFLMWRALPEAERTLYMETGS
jgi:hypothetical protein